MANICSDEPFGKCYEVFITHIGEGRLKIPLDLTGYLKNSFSSKKVFDEISKCINDEILVIAINNKANTNAYGKEVNYNETHYKKLYHYKEVRNHVYPIRIVGRSLYVSLILLNTLPPTFKIRDALLRLCGLYGVNGVDGAYEIADKIIKKAYFFNSRDAEENYNRHLAMQDLLDNYNTNNRQYFSKQYASLPGGNNNGNTDFLTEFNDLLIVYNGRNRKEIKEDFINDREVLFYLDNRISRKILTSHKIKSSQFTLDKLKMALICYAKTTIGATVLAEVERVSLLPTTTLYGYQRNQFHFIKQDAAESNFQSVRFIGEGRFSPVLGYMPGALIIAHEMGHTEAGGSYGDYKNNTMKKKALIGTVKATDSGVYNLVANENKMRKNYGMSVRTVYKDQYGCFNLSGIKTSCPAEYKYSYKQSHGPLFPHVY